MDKSLHSLVVKARAFWHSRKANVAMMFGIALVPIMIAAGAGLDMARGMMARSAMSEALDAAALAVGSTPNVTQAQAQAIALKYFNANYHGDPSYGSNPVLNAPVIDGQSVTLSVAQQVNTTLLAVGGIPYLNISASSTVVWGQTKLWVSLVLDNTGSMCEPDSNPCPGDTNANIKINALKAASHSLLGILQNASNNPGDVQVAIVPFAKDVNVGTGNVNASWVDWTDWATVVPGLAPSGSVGPGSACPFATSYGCVNGPGSTSSVSNVPSSGMICPGPHSTSTQDGTNGHWYDGCYNSVATQTAVKTVSTPTTSTSVASCTSNSTGTCTGSVSTTQSSSTGSAVTTNTTVAGYTGDSTSQTSVTANPVVGSPVITHTGSGSNKVYTTKVTTTQVTTASTITRTAAAPWNHTWVVNDHSFWSGCVMDRVQSDDVNDTVPGNGFPAENSSSCVVSSVTTLNYDWDSLGSRVDAMVANGGTNQTVGLAHGMQMLTDGLPYSPGAVPGNTTRYIILLSDGLNTIDRWYGNGSAQSTSVDSRMTTACNNAKAQNFIIYTIFVDLGGSSGNSAVLSACATDSTKYYHLTTSGAIITAFNQIGQQITALRVSR
jgi:Flp pilus assembly protein TadG